MSPRSQYNSQSGNVLFLILIAVVLFAALSYAVTSSTGSGGNKDTSDEKNKLYVAEITQYASAVRTAITLLTATSKCDDTELSFEAPPFDGSDADYVNPNSPSDFSCHIFHPNGGGVSFRTPDDKWLKGTTLAKWDKQFVFTGSDCVVNVGTGDGGCWNNGSSTDTELLMYIADVSDSLCLALNRDGGTTIKNETIGSGNFYDQSEAVAKYKGEYRGDINSGNVHVIGEFGRLFYCFYDELPDTNIYYEVLLAR